MASAGTPDVLNDQAAERRRRRGLALRISTLLVGVLHLALAAVLIGLPGSFPTLDPLPVPEGEEERAGRRPVAALSPRPASTPAGRPAEPQSTHRHESTASPEPPATPARPSRTPLPAKGAVPPSEGRRGAAAEGHAAPTPAGSGDTSYEYRQDAAQLSPAKPADTARPTPSPGAESARPGRTRGPRGTVPGSGPAVAPSLLTP